MSSSKSKSPPRKNHSLTMAISENGRSDCGLPGLRHVATQHRDVPMPTCGLRFSLPMQSAFALAHQCALFDYFNLKGYILLHGNTPEEAN